jgi:diguanylate cyclase (GGDEF)-like protein
MAKTNVKKGTTAAGISRRRSWLSISVRARVIAGFGLLLAVLASVTTGAAIQVRHHQSDLAELEQHSTMASLLQTAEAQAAISAELLQRYVYTGDAQYIDELNDHAAAAQGALNEALARGGPEGLDDVVTAGAQLEQGAAIAATLRREGDAEGALTQTEIMVPVFREYRLKLESIVADELHQVAALREQANQAGRLAFWLLVASGSIGVVFGIAISFWIARSIIKPLASLERTARRASEGDLSARATASGPTEFSHLGGVLNEMMAAIEDRTADLREANRKLRMQNRELTDARLQAATDPLTGLGNHRSFHNTLRTEAVYSNETGVPLGITIIDLDGFKDVNDSLGHLAGDQLLREVALALTRVVDREYLFRYGGDELAVILPGKNDADTVEAAERLQAALLAVVVSGHGVTASFGVACMPDSASTAEELVYRADMAMYWAKSAGKNRVSSWIDVVGNSSGPDRYINERRRPPDVVTSLRMAFAAKDATSRERAGRCAAYAAQLATALGLSDDDVAAIRLAGLIHDVGVLATPDHLLQKPGPLAADEFQVIQRHPVDGTTMLAHSNATPVTISAVRHHHERFDGTGYPDGLAGELIPVAARVIAVVDAYVAMTSDRPHRVAMSHEAAVAELQRCRESQFDPRIVDAFLHILSESRPAPETDPGRPHIPAATP